MNPGEVPPPISCLKCYALVPANSQRCPSCGTEIPELVSYANQPQATASNYYRPGVQEPMTQCHKCAAQIPASVIRCPSCGANTAGVNPNRTLWWILFGILGCPLGCCGGCGLYVVLVSAGTTPAEIVLLTITALGVFGMLLYILVQTYKK